MSESQATETPAERTMRRWYEAKLAERLLQAAAMAKDRAILRRGARKMQDGQLGRSPGAGEVEDEVINIRIGDEYHQPAAPSEPAAKASLLKTVGVPLLAAALGGGAGVGVPWLLGIFGQPDRAEPPAIQDTVRDIEIGGGEPKLTWE